MLTPIWNSLVQLQVWFLVTEYTTFSFRLKVMSQKEKVLFAVPEDQLCRTMPDQSIGNKLMGKVCSVFAYLCVHEIHETCHSVKFYFMKKSNFLILAGSGFY